jgi:hypothetical protein
MMATCWTVPSTRKWYFPPGPRAGGTVAALGGLWRRREGLVPTKTSCVERDPEVISPQGQVDEDRYRVALTAERDVAALDLARATLVADLQQLSSYFRCDRYSRRTDWKRPESKFERAVYAVSRAADYLAYAIVRQNESGMTPESIRDDMTGIVELVEYLRDVELHRTTCGRRPFLGPEGERILDMVREELADEEGDADA